MDKSDHTGKKFTKKMAKEAANEEEGAAVNDESQHG